MKKLLIVSLLILQIFSILASSVLQVRAVEKTVSPQEKLEAKISGLVVDDGTNQPIENARIEFLAKGQDTQAVTASTSAEGVFTISSIPVDPVDRFVLGTITVSSPEFGNWVMDVLLYPGETRSLKVRLNGQDQRQSDELPRAITQQQPDAEKVLEDQRQQSSSTRSTASINVNPSTINVAITAYANCSDWLNAGQAVIRVDTIDFKEYVKNVLPNEWISSWHAESLKAGAIAAKNYGWRKINAGARHYLKNMHNLDKYPDIVDNTCDQRYIANTKRASTNAAVDAIWDYRITRNGNLINNFYLATESQCLNSPYQPCMPQWGTQYRALEGKNWQQIVEQYYAPVTISLLNVVDVPNGIYRFWSDTFKSHFYTTNVEERDYVQNQLSRVWRYEGAVFNVYPTSNTTSTIPVYRFWSDRLRSHFYTASEEEKNYVINSLGATWKFEGEAWRVPNN